MSRPLCVQGGRGGCTQEEGLQVETHAQQHRYLEEHASQVVLRAQHPELGPRPNPALACGLLRAALWFGCLCAVCRDGRTISGWTRPDWLPAVETASHGQPCLRTVTQEEELRPGLRAPQGPQVFLRTTGISDSMRTHMLARGKR